MEKAEILHTAPHNPVTTKQSKLSTGRHSVTLQRSEEGEHHTTTGNPLFVTTLCYTQLVSVKHGQIVTSKRWTNASFGEHFSNFLQDASTTRKALL